eukprot:gene17457-19204_t
MCSIAKLIDNVRSILPGELAQALSDKKDIGFELTEMMLFDCRSFLAYNSRHITGAVNVNCSGIIRKRLQQGKVALADLITPDLGRECMKNGNWSKAVVYDDSTSELDKAPATHPVKLVLTSIIKQGKEALLLKGGIKEFAQSYDNLVLNKAEKAKELGNERIGACLSEQTSKLNIETTMELLSIPVTTILPYLFLGNSKDAENEKVLNDNNIKFVLNLTCNCDNHFSWRNDIKYKQVKIEDSCKENILGILQDSLHFIASAKKNGSSVLVHCQGGVSRSAAITIAYLMYDMNLTLKDAYKFVKDKRSCVAPNLNFMGQLMEFEKQIGASQRSDLQNA